MHGIGFNGVMFWAFQPVGAINAFAMNFEGSFVACLGHAISVLGLESSESVVAPTASICLSNPIGSSTLWVVAACDRLNLLTSPFHF